MILHVLSQHGLDMQNCRGQSYDNASNMSGRYAGVQARVRDINPLAEYVPCAAHSLNLVGQCVAESITEVAEFFTTVQELHNFFSVSTHRWEILVSNLKRVLKRVCTTRWSARHDACLSLHSGWSGVIAALKCIADDEKEKPKVRCEAKGLVSQLERLETALLVTIWCSILKRFNAVSKRLQEASIDLITVLHLYSSPAQFTQDLRMSSHHFQHYEDEAKLLSGVESYSFDSKRRRIRACRAGESREGDTQPENGRENFRVNVFYPIIDRLNSELQRRTNAYEHLHERFSFLDQLFSLDSDHIVVAATELISKYSRDLEDMLREECIHLSSHLKIFYENKKDSITARELCCFLRENKLHDVYPNVDIALRMLLSIPATNCSGKRSFSTLKRVKSYLRASMGQERLNALALLTIHAEIFKTIDCNEIIDKFAQSKARRKFLK